MAPGKRKYSSPRLAPDKVRHLREALKRVNRALETAGLGYWEWDLGRDKVFFSPAWKRQLGYADEALPDRIEVWRERLHPDERERVERQLRSFADSPTPDFEIEYRLRHRDGNYRWMAARCAVGRASPPCLDITHLDITHKREAEERLRYVAGHDGLTGLPNRRLLYEYAEHMVASARRSHTRLAVLFIDLDEFKPVNDTYGHHVGDRVLREAARRIAQSVRGEDIVGRIGGDEFVAVLTKIGSNRDVSAAALHTLDSLDRPYAMEELDLHVPASVGVSVFPQDGQSIESLIEHADAAMYHAKTKIGNKLQFFVPDFQHELHRKSELAERMREDLPRGGFQLVYQPVFDCDSGRIVALDAQLRWPATGLTPAEFIPLAEASGQIGPLGEWTLRQAGRQWRQWRDQGLPALPISVKVSPLQFFSKHFCRNTIHALAQEGAPPESLRLEVCEATLVRSEEEAARVLRQLKDAGIGVEIQEFGHGHSSLESLSHWPIAALKINTAHCGEALSETLLMLGRRLGCEVVGCHVETAALLDSLKRQHYPRVQGFHLCGPLAQEGVTTWHRVHGAIC